MDLPLPGSSLNRSITSSWSVKPPRKQRISLNSPVATAGNSANGTPRKVGSRTGSPGPEKEGVEGTETTISEEDGKIKEVVMAEVNGVPLTSVDAGDAVAAPTMKRPATISTQPIAKRSRSSRHATSSSTRLAPIPTDRSSLLTKYPPPPLSLSLLGGLEKQIEQLMEIVALPLLHPEIYHYTGVKPPRGVLLHGVPGGGKTRLVHCLAGELKVPFIPISAPSIVSGMSGESEKTLRETFEEAKAAAPCILFLDEVDAITPKRETAQREMEKRIVGQLLTCMDDLANHPEPIVIIAATNRPDSLDPALRRAGRFDHEIEMGVPTLEGREEILKVLCASLRLSGDVDFHSLAAATPGYVGADLTALASAAGVMAVKRIFQELGEGKLVLPTEAMDTNQQEGLRSIREDDVRNGVEDLMVVDPDESMTGVETVQGQEPTPQPAKQSMGSISSDVPFAGLPPHLLNTPIVSFLFTHPNPLTEHQLSPINLIPTDFYAALKTVQPSAQREGFATVPDVTWADIGALHAIRDELHMAIVQPIRRPEIFKAVGIEAPSGVLLWGPPGCGKTLLAKAVANESRANFISVKGPELLNKYVGESERAVRQVFARARASSPCVIFFDELDALVPRRDDNMSESSARVVNTLLTELDGLDSRKAVYVVGATNRPDMIDPAMVRPGRLDKLLYVDLPSPSERIEILKTHLKKTPLQAGGWDDVATIVSSEACDGFSGADMAALVREAATLALRSALEEDGAFENDNDPLDGSGMAIQQRPKAQLDIAVTVEHFRAASVKTLPSVSREQRRKYEMLRNKFAGLPTRGGKKWADGKGLAEQGVEVAKPDGASTPANGMEGLELGQPSAAV